MSCIVSIYALHFCILLGKQAHVRVLVKVNNNLFWTQSLDKSNTDTCSIAFHCHVIFLFYSWLPQASFPAVKLFNACVDEKTRGTTGLAQSHEKVHQFWVTKLFMVRKGAPGACYKRCAATLAYLTPSTIACTMSCLQFLT